MGPPALAAELTDHIIDFLHDDRLALSACALTHPTWLPASRFHLFNTITVDGDEGTRDRIVALDLPSGVGVLSYIRTVKIVSMLPQRRMSRLQDAVWLYRNIERGLSDYESGRSDSDGSTPHLPTVHLCLGGYQCDLGKDGILSALSQVLDRVTHLELSSPALPRRDDLWPFVSSFPTLHSLKVTDLAFHHHGDNTLPPQPGLKNIPLSKIRIDTWSMGFIIDSLLTYADVLTSLEEFGILYEDVRQTGLGAAAEAIQGKVKVLRFNAKCHPGTEQEKNRRPSASDISVWFFQQLPACLLIVQVTGMPEFVRKFESLDTLVLDNLELDVDLKYSEHFSLTWIPAVLRRLSSPIRRLVFEVSARDVSQLDAVPWPLVDELVTSPQSAQFRSLNRVEILVERRGSAEGVPFLKHRDTLRQEFEARLPGIEGMGLLRCSFVGSSR